MNVTPHRLQSVRAYFLMNKFHTATKTNDTDTQGLSLSPIFTIEYLSLRTS